MHLYIIRQVGGYIALSRVKKKMINLAVYRTLATHTYRCVTVLLPFKRSARDLRGPVHGPPMTLLLNPEDYL